MLANACWTSLRDRVGDKFPSLTGQVVTQSLELLVRQYDPFYTKVWTALTSIQQKTLLAVIEEQGVNLQSMKLPDHSICPTIRLSVHVIAFHCR